jgi:histidinol-phosphate aminotransferase
MTYEYERVATPSSGLRLHLNENTAGCSPRVLQAMRAVTRPEAAFYPDYAPAIEACARRFGIAADQVLLTNGLDEGILAAAVAQLRGAAPDGPFEAIVVQPAFDMYAACADAAGGRVVEIPPNPDFSLPVERVLAALTPRTRLIFLTDPHNPTGLALPRAALLEIAARAPQALVFLDEAYADFADRTAIGDDAFARLPNVVVGRTFAKAYGLAAVRAGALIGRAPTLAPLRRVVPPYSLNVFAAAALPAALGDTEYYEWYLSEVRASKQILAGTLERLGVPFWPSAANFVLARFGGEARKAADGLAARGIFVRDRSRDPGCAGCLRITTGVVEHTRACAAALEEVLCGAR